LEVWKGGSVEAEIGRSRVGCPKVQCVQINLHELDLRFIDYAENVALLRTGFDDLSKNDGGTVRKQILINAKLKT
jgi:hypothetical protein